MLSCCHAKELFFHPHLVSVRSFVQCSGPSLQSLVCSSFISGTELLLKGCALRESHALGQHKPY